MEQKFIAWVARRRNAEPVAYILGEQEFFSLPFYVNQHVLIPRFDTEILVEKALELGDRRYKDFLANKPGKLEKFRVLDLGTGSGAIAVSVAKLRPAWQVYAIDISEDALQVAKTNANRHQVTNVSFLQSDWFISIPKHGFSVIISNPPYIGEEELDTFKEGLQFEPRVALVAKELGMSCLKHISAVARSYLLPGGQLLFEHGYQQAPGLRDYLFSLGYLEVSSHRDLSGIERVTVARLAN